MPRNFGFTDEEERQGRKAFRARARRIVEAAPRLGTGAALVVAGCHALFEIPAVYTAVQATLGVVAGWLFLRFAIDDSGRAWVLFFIGFIPVNDLLRRFTWPAHEALFSLPALYWVAPFLLGAMLILMARRDRWLHGLEEEARRRSS